MGGKIAMSTTAWARFSDRMKFLRRPGFPQVESPVIRNAEPAIEEQENFDLIADPFIRIERSGSFRLDDIALIAETHRLFGDTPNTSWDHLRGKYLILPDWFQQGLDPMSDEYFAQQMRLWNTLAGLDRAYVAELDEAELSIPDVDPVRRPGFYIWRDDSAVQKASDHVLATGMLMKHSGIRPGMWALEYGAGFGQTALALARLGVNVDTVDISATFCGYVKEQADFFQVNLSPFKARFGENPRGDQKYDLIWFYESFHHCIDFKEVVKRLKLHLAHNGRILLAGEPIGKREYWAVPYPWGLRLESEVVAVIRNRHWFELGFSEHFITSLFVNSGYTADYFDCPMSIYGQVYSFSLRASRIDLGKHWLPSADEAGWHTPEPNGRWTRELSALLLDQTESFDNLEITATNHHPTVHPVTIAYGDVTTTVRFLPGERKTIVIDAKVKSSKITFACQTAVPGGPGMPSHDVRALGIFVHSIDYV